MSPEEKLLALAIVRAMVREDPKAIYTLLNQEVSYGTVVAIAATASAMAEKCYGHDGALAVLDQWTQEAWSEMVV
jgi:hypothetical protein